MLYGIDYLGGAKYKDVIVKHHPKGWAAGFFDDAFGDCMPSAEALARTGKCPAIRVQLTWASSHIYGDKDVPKLIAKARRWHGFKQKYPNITVYLSPFCEHIITAPDRYLDVVAKHAPSCIVVNAPLSRGGLSTKYINEFHGAEKKPRRSKTSIMFSFDGSSCVDADVETFKANYSKALIFFMWAPQCNGKKKEVDIDEKTKRPIPIPERKAWPTKEYIESWAYLATAKELTKLPADWILKSHADQHYVPPEPRAGKPLIIAPDVGPEITFTLAKGQIVTKAKKGPLFNEKRPGKPPRYIYRVEGGWGYKISQKVSALSGSPLLQIRSGRKILGQVNLAFRDGAFR